MLFPPDADLVSREADLPGLTSVLDADAFVHVLRARVPEAPLGQARATYVHYKPGTFCLVDYAIQADGRTFDAYAIAHRSDAAIKIQNAREKDHAPGPLGIGRFVVEDLALVVSFFPNDRRLRTLPILVDETRCHRLFQKIFPDRAEMWKASVETIRYRPERRYSARLVVAGQPQAVLKVYGAEDYGIAARGAKALRSSPPLRVPRRIAKSSGRHLLAFDWMDGRLLQEALTDGSLESDVFERVGRALAVLHSQRAKGLPVRSRDAEAASLLHVAADLGVLWPPLAERAWDLARDVARGIVRGPDAVVPVHGDFQAEHVLLMDEEVRVIDLDEVARADPTIDLGNFLAHLELDRVRRVVDSGRVETYRDAFLAGYASTAKDRAGLATAAGLLRLAIDPFRDREPNWPETMETILGRAEELVGRRRDSEARP